jgi:ATP-binding cassette subfamily C (CFTR/MRP) protein 1
MAPLSSQYFQRVMTTGMRLRSATGTAVFKKALRLSNTARQSSTVGEMVNLITVDAQRFNDLMNYFHMIWSAPFQIALCMYFLWQILGVSSLAGLGVMILMIPLNAYIARLTRRIQVLQMKQKDSRIKEMNEVLNGIKVIKLYAWERPFEAVIQRVCYCVLVRCIMVADP